MSITSSIKQKPGILNKIKSSFIADIDLWDFLKHDPKSLAYFLSAFLIMGQPSSYNLSSKLIETISMISGEAFDDSDMNKQMNFTEPKQLINTFKELANPNEETIQKIINDNLNPEKINIKEAKDVVSGLINYLAFQNTQGMLVKLEWF